MAVVFVTFLKGNDIFRVIESEQMLALHCSTTHNLSEDALSIS